MAGASFTIPTYFTAVDKFSSPVKGMQANLETFALKAEAGVNKAERAFRKMTPALGDASKQMLSMVGTAAIVGAAFAGAAFSVRAIMNYENELQNLKAVTGATGADFDLFKTKIRDVANETKASSVDVAMAFTAIANNQPELLKDANALAAVTKSSIILAQASKMELQPAGEALTQILNQFGKGAKEAAGTIDILAAGSVAGSSEIRDTADAIQKFGTVAANAGIKIDESVALIELSSKFEKGAEAGSKLRNILITMSTAKVQDPKAIADMHRLGVNMAIVADKSKPLSVRLHEMAKVAKDDAALFHIFGKENQALATGILNTAGNFDSMLNSVGTTGMAQKMATDNNSTLSKSLDRLSNAWVTMLTTSDGASSGLKFFTKVTEYLTRNLDTVVTVGLSIMGFFVAWWAIMKLARIGLIAYNIALGIYNALTKGSLFVTEGNVVAKYADLAVTNLMTGAQWALNAAMEANPIMIIIAALAALAIAIYSVIKYYQALEEAFLKAAATMKQEKIHQERAAVDKLSESYQKLNMSKAEADKRATSERVEHLTKTSSILKAQAVSSLLALEKDSSNPISSFISMFSGDKNLKNFTGAAGAYQASEGAKTALLNPKGMAQENMTNTINKNTKQNVTVDFKNMPQGVEVTGQDSSGDVVPISTSTMPKNK